MAQFDRDRIGPRQLGFQSPGTPKARVWCVVILWVHTPNSFRDSTPHARERHRSGSSAFWAPPDSDTPAELMKVRPIPETSRRTFPSSEFVRVDSSRTFPLSEFVSDAVHVRVRGARNTTPTHVHAPPLGPRRTVRGCGSAHFSRAGHTLVIPYESAPCRFSAIRLC